MGLSFDRIADRYDTTRWYPDQVMEDILAVLRRNLDQDRPVLDKFGVVFCQIFVATHKMTIRKAVVVSGFN